MRDYFDWVKEAACNKTAIPEKWHRPTNEFATYRAKKVCSTCPVKNDCLMHGIIYGETGIWGGETEEERVKHEAIRIPLAHLFFEKGFFHAEFLEKKPSSFGYNFTKPRGVDAA